MLMRRGSSIRGITCNTGDDIGEPGSGGNDPKACRGSRAGALKKCRKVGTAEAVDGIGAVPEIHRIARVWSGSPPPCGSAQADEIRQHLNGVLVGSTNFCGMRSGIMKFGRNSASGEESLRSV